MNLTLHDNIVSSAGRPHPEARPAIDHAVRSSWAKAMQGMLQHADARAGRFSAECRVDATKLCMRVQRHGSGSALSAIWSVGAEGRVVAASVVLAGASAPDDAAAIAAVRSHACCQPFSEGDYARLAAEPRPCLGTLYVDARWYDNARIELAATALALAALFGPECRLTIGQNISAPRQLAEQVGATNALTPSVRRPTSVRHRGGDGGAYGGFDLERPRLRLVIEMVAKKAQAALDAVPGAHFRVYPPNAVLDDPNISRGNEIFEKLSDTTWIVRWHDGRCDQLNFGEFLAFVHQVLEIEKAFAMAVQGSAPFPSRRQNDSVWGHTRPIAATPIKVNRTLDTRELVEDVTIRRLFDAVVLEHSTSPRDCIVA